MSLDRLSQILGMMGSAHDGEVLNAARAAEKLRREMGKGWGDLLSSKPPSSGRIAAAEARAEVAEKSLALAHVHIANLQAEVIRLTRPPSWAKQWLHDLTYDGVVWWRNALGYAVLVSPFVFLVGFLLVGVLYGVFDPAPRCNDGFRWKQGHGCVARQFGDTAPAPWR